MVSPFLEIADLQKTYGAASALDRVSFHVDQGELFGLLGPNGAGKTTLLSIISCLLPATAGEVRIQGKRAYPGNQELQRQIGIVPQELALYGELSARENLLFFGRLYGIGRPQLQQRVEEVLSAIGLADRGSQRVDTFSGGMKRRLNLGAALVHQPPLLLLDEPTTGVDPQSRNHLFQEIRRIHARGTTIVYTSHYMEEVQTLCSRIGIIDHGRLIACDNLTALLQQLHGWIRLHVPEASALLVERIRRLPGVQLNEPVDNPLEVECRDVKGTLIQLVAILNDLHLELISLETQEPNLERVFLHLTGRELRD
jgi:ABC-2 type transport system ATP-binding protein